MDKKEVVVVVPVYRPELTVWERASLRQTVGVLQENYPVELLVPCGMDCSAIRREFSGLPVREVSDEWLGRKNGIAGYNRMMPGRIPLLIRFCGHTAHQRNRTGCR